MTKPQWFEPKISFGNVVQIITILIAVVIGWQTLKSDVRSNSERITSMERISTIQLDHIKNTLKRIERTVEGYRSSSASSRAIDPTESQIR